MLDITRILFVPLETAKTEAAERGAIKKLVDKRFGRDDKKRILANKGLNKTEVDDELAKFVPEVILPTGEIDLVSQADKSLVIESESIALSYTSGTGPEDPHWHPDEVETYLTTESTEVAFRSVDEPGKHNVVCFPPGRLIFPPRTCHFTDLTAHTEVISFRQRPMMQRVNCQKCFLRENKDCEGLEKGDKGFTGEKALVGLAKTRRSRLTKSTC